MQVNWALRIVSLSSIRIAADNFNGISGDFIANLGLFIISASG